MNSWVPALVILASGVSSGALASKWFSERLSAQVRECVPQGGVVTLPGGTQVLGRDDAYPDEGPSLEVIVDSFDIDRHEVTNSQFSAFVSATGYVTTAERMIEAGWPSNGGAVLEVVFWEFVQGASWRAPDGPGSSIEGKGNHPVVQVSLEDAQAYAAWANRRLPTEAEWEYAARLGGALANPTTADLHGKAYANTWQGTFPVLDSGADGFAGRAPVGCYQPDDLGLYDMIGNVWEWTSDAYIPTRLHDNELAGNGAGYDPRQPDIPAAVIKGGSFQCTSDFCSRYRPAAREAQETGLGTNHIGFRTVGDASIAATQP